MLRNLIWGVIFIVAFEGSAQAKGEILNEYKIKGRNKFVGKETFIIRTFCIDGYKFITVEDSFIQFYENQDGLPMPSQCDP